MTCAKKQVTCYIVKDGIIYTGKNDCKNPREFCPRFHGEGYEKCKSICQQEGHAEEMAMREAGIYIQGSDVYITGITYYCRLCQEKLFAAGVRSLRIGIPSELC